MKRHIFGMAVYIVGFLVLQLGISMVWHQPLTVWDILIRIAQAIGIYWGWQLMRYEYNKWNGIA